jgi:hypothetical protein
MSRFNKADALMQSNCGPTLKDLKLDLAKLKEATELILELIDGGYIHYDVQDSVLGSLFIRKRNLKKMVKEAKKYNKE